LHEYSDMPETNARPDLTASTQLLYTGSVDKQPLREWDWFSACVLFVMLQVVTARLVTTNWAPFLYFTETLAGLGTMLGLALGDSRFRPRTAASLAVVYTVFVVPWQLTAAVKDDLLLDRLSHLGQILLVSLDQFMQRQPVKDSLFFVAFVCLAFWLIGVLAGYWFARGGRVLGAIILSGMALITVQVYANYQSHGSWWLAVYLLMALLLVGRAYYLQSKKDWIRRRVFVNEEAWPAILGSLLMTAGIAILAAWLIPVSPAGLNTASDWWNSVSRPIRDRLSNAVSPLNGPYGRPSGNFYGSTLAIGRNAAAGDTTVFRVDVLQGAAATPRFYWRGRVYDQYSDGQWSTLPASTNAFNPQGGDLAIPDAKDRSAAQLQFTSQFPSQSLLYGPSQPVWFDHPALILAEQPEVGVYDIFSWEANAPLAAGGVYEVKAELADPNVQQLRAADTSYPQWISDRYLRLPDRLRGQMQALAEKVSAGESNPYDKAAAITDYLRANLQYSLAVPAPPEGQDPVAWVLFDYKRGFCNYYASAEVLLLRSVGIPARLAVGFAQGEMHNGVYVVRRRDAHAWPEAYFPGYGWLEFEPTVSQAPLVRPDLATEVGGPSFNPRLARPREGEEGAGPNNMGTASLPKQVPLSATPAARILLVFGVLSAAGGLIYIGMRTRIWVQMPAFVSSTLQRNGMSTPAWIEDWIRWNRLEPVERSFASINWSLRWLGHPQPVDATPAERARVLGKLLPSAAAHIAALESEFESGIFTLRPANLTRARRASFLILVHLVRARVQRIIRGADDADVY
jgi:transglutaminase-like putative cysteine protease